MKELTIEQKAKLYDEALEAACCIYNNMKEDGNFSGMEDLEVIFPELKKSEDDKIKKEIITYLSTVEDKELIPYESWIAWLERQGAQKPLEEGTFVNVDEVREDFMQEVYRVLDADPTNDRANQIIDAFDNLPTTSIQKPAKNIADSWKNMRLEVYQQASGNRHELNCSDDNTKMFSLNDIDEIIEKISEQKTVEWSEEDERSLQIVIGILDREHYAGNITTTDLIACVRKLKSLRSQAV